MTRMIGAAMLTVGSAALGLGGVAQLEGRVRDLRGVICGLEAMKRELAARMEPLEGMLSAAVRNTDGRPKKLFEFCLGQFSHRAENFSALWGAALDTVSLCLEAEDISELRQIGSVLGRFDADSQTEAFGLVLERLGRQLDGAMEQRARMGKVYGTAGLSAGLLLTILLL